MKREYNKKRNFQVTTEPKFKKITKKHKDPIFVVQEHHASHLHYDFRLELDGALKSWAVPKGPSLDPNIKRLAVEVEDHPLDYATFEGIIPEKQYGAGQVIIWDHGTWENLTVKDYKKTGRLEFELHGERLHGKWLLIRTNRQSGKKNQWLLIKRNDEYVKKNDQAAVLLKSKKKVNFINPQLALLAKTPPQGEEWIHEIKFDGYRTQAHLHKNESTLYSRNGHDWTKYYSKIAADLKKIKNDVVLDGEVVSLDAQGKSNFQDLQEKINSGKSDDLYFYVFDLLFLDGQDFREKPLLARKAALKKIITASKLKKVLYSDHFQVEGKDILKASCSHQLEGVISKHSQAPYVAGRNGSWIKTKCKDRQEFVIGGYTYASGDRAGFGAMLLGVYENNKLRYVGRVGTGFNQGQLQDLYKKMKKLELKVSPFDLKSPKGSEIHWIKPTMVAEVSFSNWTREKILRVPVFESLRDDKPAKKIKEEKPVEVVKITHPEKIIFKQEKITKQKIKDYYSLVANRMLPHLSDRPVSLLRCPSGSAQKCFFQKHLTGEAVPGISTVAGNYPVVFSEIGLMSLVQMGTLEFHMQNVRQQHFDYPDQIIMDFDPGPKIGWEEVKAGAFRLKEILDHLKLKSFIKLSGGKGVHIHIPVSPIYNIDQIKNFSHSLAKQMSNENPLFTDKMSKAGRDKKIFVDYLRNSNGATAVAPYSLRSRKISAVAMPISWKDLNKIKSADFFTLDKAILHLRKQKSDPWKDYYKVKQKISLLKILAN